MNCKPGDLAVVVALDEAEAPCSNYGGKTTDVKLLVADIRGCIVRCIRLCGNDWEVDPRRVTFQAVTSKGRSVTGEGTVTSVPDAILRPLRDSPGEDETLLWAAAPSAAPAQAGKTKGGA